MEKPKSAAAVSSTQMCIRDRLMLGEVRDLMRDKGMEFSWDDSVLDYLVKKSYSLTYGARNLRRTIQKDIEEMCIRDRP